MNPSVFWIFADFSTTLKAFAVFTFFMVAPGFVAGWLSDACGFRNGSLLRRAALTVPLSIAVLPIVVYLPWRFFTVRTAWLIAAAIGVAFLSIVAKGLLAAARTPGAFRCDRRRAWAVGAVAIVLWLAIGLGSLLDLRFGNKLYLSYTTFDYLSRVPIANSISHQEQLPAVSPFLTMREPVPLRYHYFWPMIGGLVTMAGRGAYTARDATIAGALWAGIALICLIAVYLRVFQGVDASRRRPYIFGIALLGVTGLDILPVALIDLQHYETPSMILPTTEWWNEQITGWLDAMLWVPHHMTALVACLMAFLVLWCDSEEAAKLPRPAAIVLAALALASAAGMSVYVTFVFACVLVAWAAVMLLRKHPKAALAVAAAGALSMVLALPFLLELRSTAGSATSPTKSPLIFQVRRFALLPEYLGPLGLISRDQNLKTTVNRLLFLPLNYFLELGVYFYVAVICLKRLWKARPISNRDVAAVTMLVVSVLICTFLASDVAASGNDLGWRGFMAAQFILLLWAAGLLSESAALHRGQRAALVLLLVIGASSTAFDLALLRGYNMFIDSQWFNDLGSMPPIQRRMGERFAARADTYAWIRAHTPVNAVVEANPDTVAYFYGLYAERPALAIGGECDGYSNHAYDCYNTKLVVRPLFSGEARLSAFPEACRDFPLDYVVIADNDPVWLMHDSWIHHVQPVYSTEFTRVFSCK